MKAVNKQSLRMKVWNYQHPDWQSGTAYPLEGKRGIGQGPTIRQHRQWQCGIAYPREGKRGISLGPTVVLHRQRQSSGTGSLAAVA